MFVTINVQADEYPAFENDEYLAKEYQQCSDSRVVPADFISHNHENYEMGSCLDLYYDTVNNQKNTSQDWAKVIACAKQKDDHETLMMLNANGFGMKRDINLAIAHACYVGGAPAEIKYRLEHLNQLIKPQKSKSKYKIFDICDDITSGFMMGICSSITETQDKKKRAIKLSKLSENWTKDQQYSFNTVKKAHQAFAEAHGNNETDLSGTARGAFIIGATAGELDNFLNDFSNFEQGKLPNYSEQEYKNTDKELNLLYKKVLLNFAKGDTKIFEFSGLSPANVVSTQKTWLIYRDGLTKFGQLKYFGSTSYSWKAHATKQRIKNLEELLEIIS